MDNPVFTSIFSINFLATIIRVTTPIYLAAIGGLLTIYAGKKNIALEGTMLVSAFFGVIVSYLTASWFWGLVAAVVIGVIFSGILALFILNFDTHVAIAGLGMNIFAAGLTVFLLYIFTGEKGTSISLDSKVVPSINLAFLSDVPILNTLIGNQNLFVYISIIFAILLPIFIYKTKLGIYIRAVGENPDACESLGINVRKIRWIAFLLCGFITGFAGANLSMAYSSFFIQNMSSGRGFIALAAVGLGNNHPWGVLLSTLLFGASDALGSQLSTLDIFPQLIISIPYVVTLIALVFYQVREQRIINSRRKKNIQHNGIVDKEQTIDGKEYSKV